MLSRLCLVAEAQNVFTFAVPDDNVDDDDDDDDNDNDDGDYGWYTYLQMSAPLATGSKRKSPLPMLVSRTSYLTWMQVDI